MEKVSIISVVYNNRQTVSDTIESVIKQDYQDIEYIIIDGNSDDGTKSLIQDYDENIDIFISETDEGIYDAMNKGLAQATGDIIGFLNGDDFYLDERVIQDIVEKFSSTQCEACYADLDYVDGKDTEKIIRRWKAGLYKKGAFFWGWMPPHPTFFASRKIYEKYGGFNLDLGSAADYEIMLRFIHKYDISVAYLSRTIIKMRAGGISNASILNRLKANKNDRKAWEINGLTPKPYTLLLKPLRKLKQFLG